MTISREDFDAAVRQLEEAVAQNTADLRIQFERIAQMQAELDVLRKASERRSRKKSTSPPIAVAADEQR
jgi:hypothetical protein